MEIKRLSLPPINAPGQVTSFYAYESGVARSVALSNTAVVLAGRNNGTSPVLMIDWDTEAPGLHHHFGRGGQHDGLVEYFQACRDYLATLGRTSAAPEDTALARQVLEAVDWEPYVERVDESRPLYLMRAGRFDDTYGERAAQMDWDGLFQACPALFRQFGEHLARRFRHVLIDARSGRSAVASICTTLLPARLVAVFTPNQRSVEGVCGVIERAVEYRCSHEHAQQPLLVYPLPSSIDSADCERRALWRRGDAWRNIAGYQSVFEALMRKSYSLASVSLDSYFDEVQLQQTAAIAGGDHLALAPRRDSDRFSLARTVDALLEWLEEGRFPWQSLTEVRLTGAIAAARALDHRASDNAVAVPLARHLHELGCLQRDQRCFAQAIACFEESLSMRQHVLGDEHGDTRASRAELAAMLRDSGKLAEAGFLHELLYEDCYRLLGADHPDTLAARAALAATLSALGEHERALALHEQVVSSAERLYGSNSAATFDSLAGRARALAAGGEPGRARMVYERVLEGRERLLGSEHTATLDCASELALVLYHMGEHHHARKLQQDVVAARERHCGHDHPLTLQARAQLAQTLAGQRDIASARDVLQALSAGRERALGNEHPDTLSSQLQLAAALGESGQHDAARLLQQQVVALQEKMHGSHDSLTLESKKALAATLSHQGHSVDARRLEDAVLDGAARLDGYPAMASGPHDSHAAAAGLRQAIEQQRDHLGQAETLSQKLQQLQQLIDNRSEREARELADSLRKFVLKPGASHPLRLQGVELIKQVYLRDNDKDALLSFTQDQVSALQEALKEAANGRPMSTL
ncbi:tetratricopeptide repeat protein [Massilia sp. PAMC28688]|uniref:tetratricopeptide repeat protein n=1 Tax=Massilia sp. PAMC28688 TaxID=2861283 RepID=UPI001C632DD9|nr:tetratricopeptide repeat protein [Massilia sp. PAMC28688]QYF92292.1 tetratricopeptide repeat protein [Massilia sp. PAMC28688]